MLPSAGQIPHSCRPLCLQTLTQTFSQANGEEFRRKEPDSPIPGLKRTEYDMVPKCVFVNTVFFTVLKHFITKGNTHKRVRHDLLE
jgi:hypothetical protein